MWLGISFVALFPSLVFGNWNDTSTGIDLGRLPHPPLQKLRTGPLKPGAQERFDGILAVAGTSSVPEVQLSGAGKSGRRWEVHIDNLDEVWRADLDGNGTQDYVLFSSGPFFNGRTTPLFSLSILLLDQDRMPVPFFTVLYHGENGAGIKHLVDLNHDGKAELLINTYDENASDPLVGGFCSGHWTTQLYRFKDLGVEEIRGTVGEVTFPFVHNWTYRGTLCDRQEKPFMAPQPPTFYEHGTSTQGEPIRTTLRSVNGAGDLEVERTAGCKTINPRVIVYDRPKMRKIAFTNLHTTFSTDLAAAILQQRARVELRGIDRWMGDGYCSVNLMWAK